MSTPKYKHLRYEDRCVIQEFLNHGYSFTAIGNRIGKDRRTVAKEVMKHRFVKYLDNRQRKNCPFLEKTPHVCNGCHLKTHCRCNMYLYEANIAQMAYERTLSEERKNVRITDAQIAEINERIAPLMIHKHHSVNHVYATHGDLLPFSKSTFYRYIDQGLFRISNLDLRRKCHYRLPKSKEERRPKARVSIKVDRFYRDFQDYMEIHPHASVVEMDTVVGTTGGKGGKCMLTLLFRSCNVMLIYLLPYKKQAHVIEVFKHLKELLGDDCFSRLFEVILTDNGTEFLDPVSIEMSFKTGEKLSNLFYCDSYCSWQKGRLEKNHEYIRYILPKGTSFAGLSQEDCYLIASHINSVPRDTLNHSSPYEVGQHFIGEHIMNALNIQRIPNDEIILSRDLLKKNRQQED